MDSGVKVRLVIPASVDRQTLEIRHDGYGNFTFPIRGTVERVAVVDEVSTTLYREYQFSKISGGSVLTRTIQPYPAPPVVELPEPEPEPEPELLIEEPVVEDEPEEITED